MSRLIETLDCFYCVPTPEHWSEVKMKDSCPAKAGSKDIRRNDNEKENYD